MRIVEDEIDKDSFDTMLNENAWRKAGRDAEPMAVDTFFRLREAAQSRRFGK